MALETFLAISERRDSCWEGRFLNSGVSGEGRGLSLPLEDHRIWWLNWCRRGWMSGGVFRTQAGVNHFEARCNWRRWDVAV